MADALRFSAHTIYAALLAFSVHGENSRCEIRTGCVPDPRLVGLTRSISPTFLSRSAIKPFAKPVARVGVRRGCFDVGASGAVKITAAKPQRQILPQLRLPQPKPSAVRLSRRRCCRRCRHRHQASVSFNAMAKRQRTNFGVVLLTSGYSLLPVNVGVGYGHGGGPTRALPVVDHEDDRRDRHCAPSHSSYPVFR